MTEALILILEICECQVRSQLYSIGSDLIGSPGTYGGHVELAVFARLKKRDVKVIQPDVCYVIEHKQLVADDDDAEPSTSSGSPKRRKAESQIPFLMTEGTIYVA